jgi:Ca2+-binding RTX toxin-like protein
VAAPGTKRVVGGDGADRIYAEGSGTTVIGGAGNDVLIGGAPSSDATNCPSGCQLGLGSQTFDGGPGADVVYGERGNDVINGNAGADRLYGGIGDDKVNGGDDGDLLSGGWGVDTLDGQGGDDLVRGDGSRDRLRDSGGGTDTVSFATALPPGPSSPPAGFPADAGDRGVYVNLAAGVGDNGDPRFGGGVDDEVDGADFENVIGSPFSDYIVGNSGANVIYAGGGADTVLGGDGTDQIHGGADGDQLDGQNGTDTANGDAGSDDCTAETENGCNAATGVTARDPAKIAVGLMTPTAPGPSEVYLAGSSQGDSVTATYSAGSPATFTFTAGSANFDAGSGCMAPSSSTQAVCTLDGPLDTIVMYGASGADNLQASNFDPSTSVVLDGGPGADTLGGGDQSEDVLVDDSGTGGADNLNGLGRDDALLDNGGADQIHGGDGNDLLLTNALCNGDVLDGGAGRDNASWVRLDTAVEANLTTGVAGHPGSGSTPTCGASPLDQVSGSEDVEGGDFGDAFYGDGGDNNLLGWGGADTLRGAAGDDRIYANAGDDDPQVSCGDGLDRVLLDRPPHTDSADPGDCEIVEQADFGTFAFTIQPLTEPAFTGTSPASPADDNSPEVLGTAPADTTVRLYSIPGCPATSLVAQGTAADFADPGISVSVPNNSTTTLYAIARSSTSASECSSSSITYVESSPDAPPTAVNDSATVPENSGQRSIDVLANDTDPDGGPRSVASVTPASHGTAAVGEAGSGVTYAPSPGWCGTDAFTYSLNGGSTATVTVTVECVPKPKPPRLRCGGLAVTRAGTAHADVINGTGRRDVIAALGGNDLVRGRGGNDVICGGAGNDRLLGGDGPDTLLGGPGRDRLLGGPGRDRQRQ